VVYQRSAYGNLAFVYMSKGEYDRALAEYTHALELDPRFAKAYNGRAQLYNKKGC
jgi:Tfp pilus assembly protein PilF